MTELKTEYIKVNKSGKISYGGSQLDSSDSVMRQCGCGVVAVADLLLYLAQSRADCALGPAAELCGDGAVSQEEYDELCMHLKRSFLPLLPPVGINGVVLALGVNLYCMRYHLPLRARWAVPKSRLWDSMEEMLLRDLPVIFAVGPNFPMIWKDEKLNFYVKREGEYIKAGSAKAHFITLTGMDENWLQISSWGRRYYINRAEFTDYVHRFSMNYLSSILYISEK